MGLLDGIVGQVLGNSGAKNSLLNAVMSMVGNQQAGGLAGLVDQFKNQGLGDIVSSWVGTGKNLPITPEQIQQGLGSETIKKLASQAGLDPELVSSHLSQLLPHVVDKLTPDGNIPQGDILSKGVGLLKDLMQ